MSITVNTFSHRTTSLRNAGALLILVVVSLVTRLGAVATSGALLDQPNYPVDIQSGP